MIVGSCDFANLVAFRPSIIFFHKNRKRTEQKEPPIVAMPHCENCNAYLASNTAIQRHLAEAHGIHVRLGGDSVLAYCEDCHRYCGTKHHGTESRKSLEKHLKKHHNVDIQG